MVSEGIGTTWLNNGMWFQLWRLKQWVLCVTLSMGRSSLQQGSWSSILLGLPGAMRSQKLRRDVFPFYWDFLFIRILLGFWIVVMEWPGFTWLWNIEWLGSRLDAEEKYKAGPNRRKKGRKAMMFCWSKCTDFKTRKDGVFFHSSVGK